MENTLVKRAPQRLIIGKPISQYASYSAMFCPLHSNIGKEQHAHAPIHPAITENILAKRAPHPDLDTLKPWRLNFCNG